MTAWYRNEDWSPQIAAEFERRLSRSRHQKAQHLSIQGFHLIRKHPTVACDLLERAVALDDEYQMPRAMGYLATARLATGDVTAALDSYERALERQMDHPNAIAVQPADYIFIVGLFERRERLPLAQRIADALPDDGLLGPDLQVFAAKAMIFSLSGRHDDARRYAALALPLMETIPDVCALGIEIADLRERLSALANA